MGQTEYERVGDTLAENSAHPSRSGLVIRYGLEDWPKPAHAVLFAMQHVLIMFSAMISTPLIIAQLLGLSPEVRGTLISGVMLGCGIGTIISALGVSWVGARLPLLLGAYTVYIGPVVAIAKAQDLGAAAGAMLIGGVFLVAISPVIGRLRPLFPPVVVGTLLVLTGLTLLKIAMGVSFGTNTPYFGLPITVIFLVASVILITVIASFSNPFVKSLSVLITLVGVYIAAIATGFADLSPIWDAPWITIPTPLPLGIAWPSVGGAATMVIYSAIAAIYTMSITMSLCAMIRVEATESRIRGAVAGDGVGSVLSVLLGGVPLISYDQNVGVILLTGVASRFVVALAGALLACMAFMPKFAAVIGMVPAFMLGGTLVFMFGMIVVVGIKILSQSMTQQRDVLVVAGSIGLSAVANFAPAAAFEMFPDGVRILAADGIVVGTVVAVILNRTIGTRAAPSA